MTPDFAIQLVREALMTAFWLAAPILSVGFAAAVVVSLLQILTSIQDSAFSSVPRLTAVLAALIITLPWMLQKAVAYTTTLLGDLSRYAR
jgi:flagellar biosynthesis protein FliQ